MAFLLILSIIALNNSIEAAKSNQQKFSEIAKLVSVNNKFDNINRGIVDLKKSGTAKQYNERILPFSYNIDLNSISFSRNLPFGNAETDGFFDFINLYSVLLEDSSYANVFDGLAVDVNTIQNSSWGGSAKSMHFLIEPFCYQFTIIELNKAVFEESKSSQCSEAFDLNRIKRFDANVSIKNFSEDLNMISCNGGACPDNPFNPASALPYYRISIDDSNCGKCSFSQKIIADHFSPDADSNVLIYCQGAGCVSKSILFGIGKSFSVERSQDSNYRVLAELKASFDSNIGQFLFLDFNFSVQSQDYDIVKSNNPLAVN